MPKSEYAQRQRESIKILSVNQPLYDRIAQFAEDNAMSVSEVMREAIEMYATGSVPRPDRKRRTRRVGIWIPPAEWMAFKRRITKEDTRIADAIEAALEEYL